MELTAREKDRLLLFTAALPAERRRVRGLKLNYPEAVALISAAIMEGSRDGRTVADLMSDGKQVLSRADVRHGPQRVAAADGYRPADLRSTRRRCLAHLRAGLGAADGPALLPLLRLAPDGRVVGRDHSVPERNQVVHLQPDADRFADRMVVMRRHHRQDPGATGELQRVEDLGTAKRLVSDSGPASTAVVMDHIVWSQEDIDFGSGIQ